VTPIFPSAPKRRPYRVPLGIPKGREDWRIGSGVSLLLHISIIVLLLMPLAVSGDIREMAQGAGGAGPAGGGGGGTRGTGAMRAEMLRFVRVEPPPPAPTPQVKVVPPVTPPPPEPPTPQPQIETPKLPTPSVTSGTGGGTGSDNTTGSGPGSGGGVGSGIGTGKGSAVGPGTGGGNQANYPPTPIEMFIPPLPVPASVRGFHLIAEFDVDEKGKVVGMTFTETRDRGYNRRVAEVLKGFRFRPGTTPDGTPIRMKAQVTIDLP
jgi:periplasmic protein TonB